MSTKFIFNKTLVGFGHHDSGLQDKCYMHDIYEKAHGKNQIKSPNISKNFVKVHFHT